MNFIEISQRILALLETIEEGFYHIRKQLSELRYEEAMVLFRDCIDGIGAIETSMEIIKRNLPENNRDILLKEVYQWIHKTTQIYKEDQKTGIENYISLKLIPAFEDWKEEIESMLRVKH